MAIHNSFREPGCDVRHAPKPGTSWMFIDVNIDAIRAGNPSKTFAAGDDLRVAKIKNEWAVGRAYYRVKKAFTAATTLDVSITQNGTTTDLIASAVDGTTTTEWVEGYDVQGQNDGYIWLELNGATVVTGTVQIAVELFSHPEDAEPVGSTDLW